MDSTLSSAFAKVLRYATTVPTTLMDYVLSSPQPPLELLYAALSRPETSPDHVRRLQDAVWERLDDQSPTEALALADAIRTSLIHGPAAGVRAGKAALDRGGRQQSRRESWYVIARNAIRTCPPDHPLLEGMARSRDRDVLHGFLGAVTGHVRPELLLQAVLTFDELCTAEPFSTEAWDVADQSLDALRILGPQDLSTALMKVENPHTIYAILGPTALEQDTLRKLTPKVWSRIVRHGALPLLRALAQDRSAIPNGIRTGFAKLARNLWSVPDQDVRDLGDALRPLAGLPGDATAPGGSVQVPLAAVEKRLRRTGTLPFSGDITWSRLSGYARAATPVADWVVANTDDWAALAAVMSTLGADASVTDTVTTAAGVA